MDIDALVTEIFCSRTCKRLAAVRLDWQPQPGQYLELDGQSYAVLERRHRYQLEFGRYRPRAIALYVQRAAPPKERTWLASQWVVGDASCRYNARSPLLRCAVNPDGPCQGCRAYEARPSDGTLDD